MNPPLVLVCILKTTGSYQSFVDCNSFIINILEESQQQISNHFASHLDDKFLGMSYELNEKGLPILTNCLVNLECGLRYSYEGGDHTIFVGEIEKAKVFDGNPLLYWQSKYRQIND